MDKDQLQILNSLKHDKRKKCIGKSTLYSHVSVFELLGVTYYKAQINRFKWFKFYSTEKDAAKAVDLKLIEKGEVPINVLKAKK